MVRYFTSRLPITGRSMVAMVLPAVFAIALTSVATYAWRLPKSISFDSVRGLLAAMQFDAGLSPNLVTLTSANPVDLSSDVKQRESWRAPGYQAVPYLLVRLGLAWGTALRTTIVTCLLFGCAAWGMFYWLVLCNRTAAVFLMITTVCSSFVVSNIDAYQGGNLLLWTTTPLLVLANVVAMRGNHSKVGAILAFLGGCFSMLIFLIKYSGIFVGIGVVIAWVIAGGRSWHRLRGRFFQFGIGVLVGSVVLFSLREAARPTVVENAGAKVRLLEAATSLGAWPVSATDLAGPIYWLSRLLGASNEASLNWVTPGVGLLVLATVAGLQIRSLEVRSLFRRIKLFAVPGNETLLIALCVAAADTGLYAISIASVPAVEVSARLAKVTGMLLLPFILLALRAPAVEPFLQKLVRAGLLVALFGVAPAFGTYRFVATVRAANAGPQDSPSGVRVTSLGSRVSTERLHDELRALLSSSQTVLYVTFPDILLLRPSQRFVLVYVLDQARSIEELRLMAYHGLPESGIALLLSPILEIDGRAEAIRDSFKDVDGWKQVPLHSALGWSVWLSSPS